MMTVINLTAQFELKKIVNLSRRLIEEMGYTNKIWITIEKDKDSEFGSNVILVDVETQQKIKIDNQKLKRYYERKECKDLSDLLSE